MYAAVLYSNREFSGGILVTVEFGTEPQSNAFRFSERERCDSFWFGVALDEDCCTARLARDCNLHRRGNGGIDLAPHTCVACGLGVDIFRL